ncbi:MAG: NUDIX hydrolase [Flammeovirgaceae bacterium]|nr:NUDIX hydrolase [Flammeovirgaceae bacterium]
MDRGNLVKSLHSYLTAYKEEANFVSLFLDLLKHPRCYLRDHLPGHVTGSAWIIDPIEKVALLTHHAKLDKWLQPGGHADGEEDILTVAINEMKEETGISLFKNPVSFFDIDIHPIPARNDFPLHDHYDVRFLIEADSSSGLVISSESKELRWISWGDVGRYTSSNRSIERMLDKTIAIYRV